MTLTYKAITLVIIIIITTLMFWDNSQNDFSMGSEDLVVGMIAAARHNIEIVNRRYGLGYLVSAQETEWIPIGKEIYYDSGVNPEQYIVLEYQSQIGLQGFIFYFMTRFGLPKPYPALRLGCCLLLAIVLLSICHELYKKYGLIFSGVFYIMTITSSLIVNFAPNLYWVEFTWFIPMLLGLICLNNLNKRLFLYPLFFLAIVVKCACGYEYITVIMLSSIMFLFVEWVCTIKKGREYRHYGNSLLKAIFMIGIMSLIGFAVTLLIHSHIRGAGDILAGLKDIYKNDVLRRTYGTAADFPERLAGSLNASVTYVLIIYFTRFGLGKFALFLLIATTAIMVYKHIAKRHPLNTQFWLFIVSLMTCISWFVLAKSHSWVHVGLNFVLWYMGYIQVCTYIVLKFVLNSDIGKSVLKHAASILRIEVYPDI